LRILKIEKHGLIYFAKIKTEQLKIVWLALSASLKSLNRFKINFEKNCKNETGIEIDHIDFDLKDNLKNKIGMFSSIKKIGEIHMFLLALNTSHRIVDKIKILSVHPKKNNFNEY
jgi:hypothetical protein